MKIFTGIFLSKSQNKIMKGLHFSTEKHMYQSWYFDRLFDNVSSDSAPIIMSKLQWWVFRLAYLNLHKLSEKTRHCIKRSKSKITKIVSIKNLIIIAVQ